MKYVLDHLLTAAPNPSRTQATGGFPPWAIILIVAAVAAVAVVMLINRSRSK